MCLEESMIPGMGKPRRAESPFVSRPGAQGHVVLNTGHARSELAAYADHYRIAADKLVADLKARGGTINDLDACPIAFLYRHAVELALKAILARGHDLLRLSGKPGVCDWTGRHDLLRLASDCERVFEVAGWKWQPDIDCAAFRSSVDFRGFLASIDEVDPRSMTFRYPINKRGDASTEPHFKFDVFELGDRMGEFIYMLIGATDGLEELWDNATEDLSCDPYL